MVFPRAALVQPVHGLVQNQQAVQPGFMGEKPRRFNQQPCIRCKDAVLPDGLPKARAVPSLGRSKPQMHFDSTIMPLPLRPMMPWIFHAPASSTHSAAPFRCRSVWSCAKR